MVPVIREPRIDATSLYWYLLCWCYVLRWIRCLWYYSECISTPGRLEKYACPRWESNLRPLEYTITLWFPCLDGLKKSARNTSRRRVILRAFLNSSNIPKCLDQAIQTRKP
jgi:hypothetical protein